MPIAAMQRETLHPLEGISPAAYPVHPDPPQDARPRTSLADMPAAVRRWVRNALGADCRITPVAELVNSNHSFIVRRGSAGFFLKVLQRGGAADRLRREVAALDSLRGLPCPEVVRCEVLRDRLAVLLTTWLDAQPMRHLDFHGLRAPIYTRELGMVLARFHERLRGLEIPDARRRLDLDLHAAEAECAADRFLDEPRKRLFLRLWGEAQLWLRGTPWQQIHGDLQDKNILLSRPGRLFLCDFEAVRYGPVVCELSVDRIYLKRNLPEKDRARLQRLLLEGYGCDPGLDFRGASMVRLLRLAELMAWRFRAKTPAAEAGCFCSAFDLLADRL